MAVRFESSKAKLASRVALNAQIVLSLYCSFLSEIPERANSHALIIQVEICAPTQNALVAVGPGTGVAAVVARLASN